MLTGIRKAMGQMIFNRLVHPPMAEGMQLVYHGGDYGHGYLYEELFCRNERDLDSACQLISAKPGAVLDLAGGAGRLSARVCAMGREVVLVDQAVSMLSIARRRRQAAPREQQKLWRIHPQDMTRLELAHRFELIFSVNSGLEHCLDEESLASTLSGIRTHLAPGGSAYLDVHYLNHWEKTPGWLSGQWEYTDDFTHEGERYRVWARTTAEDNGMVVWEHALSQDLLNYKCLRTPLRILPLKAWHVRLERAGLRVRDIWGSWQGSRLSDQLPRLIFWVELA